MRTPPVFLGIIPLMLFGVDNAEAATYAGTWSNTTFSSFGGLSFQFDVVGTDISGTFDVDGFAFGGADPDPVAILGTVDGGGNSSFSTVSTDPNFGDLSGTITSTGILQAQMVNIPSAFIYSATVSGTFDPVGGLSATYRVNFNATADAGGGVEGTDFAVGTTTATLVPEPSAALSLAITAGVLGARRRRSC